MARILKHYRLSDGSAPFLDWLSDLKDKVVRLRIAKRLDQIHNGNFGDHQSVGGGVWELRLHFGPGFRVYYGLDGDEVVLILCGGDKSTQNKDISKAQEYWKDHLRSKEEEE